MSQVRDFDLEVIRECFARDIMDVMNRYKDTYNVFLLDVDVDSIQLHRYGYPDERKYTNFIIEVGA